MLSAIFLAIVTSPPIAFILIAPSPLPEIYGKVGDIVASILN